MPPQRYKLTLAYRGTQYHGWQRQLPVATYKGEMPEPGHGIPTIQETLSRAFAAVLNHPVTIVGSSRTDAGVHAKGQVAHFDSDQSQIPLEGLRMAVNHKLPADILIKQIEPIDSSFDAISSTINKRYQYFVWNALNRNPFFPDLAWHRWQELDIPGMQQAAAHLVGEHDFTSFARPGHRRQTTVRTINNCSVSSRGHHLIIGIEGSGFLWNMVRIIVGTLVEVGLKKYNPADIPNMLSARDRRSAGSTAPPHGLYLQWVQTRLDSHSSSIPIEERDPPG